MKKPIAYIENDAVGCFDRIANPLVLIFLLAIGVSQSTLQSLAKSWEKSIHKIRSMYGISQASYTNDYSQLLFGRPFLWLLCFLLITLSLSGTAPRIQLESPDKTCETSFVDKAFVDNTGLGTNLFTPSSSDTDIYNPLVTNLQNLAQEWE
jgi:hypothetical protein